MTSAAKKSNLRPYAPGQSGNPGGRPKGMALEVKRLCGADGRKLVEAWLAIALGTAADHRKIFGKVLRPGVKDRLSALEQLADRGFGRPTQGVQFTDENDQLRPMKVIFGGRYRPKQA